MAHIHYKASLLPDPTDPAFEQEVVPSPVDATTFATYKPIFIKYALLDPRSYVKVRRAEIAKWETILEERRNQSPHNDDLINATGLHLQRIKKDMPPGPIYPSTEPPDLDPIVYYRLYCLHEMFDRSESDTPKQTNINAVIAAYRSGELQHDPTHVTFWWGGVMVERLSSEEEFNFDYQAGKARWKAHGEGALFKERITPIHQQL